MTPFGIAEDPSLDEKSDRRARRDEQHGREIEQNQDALRRSIEETRRLVSESEEMLRRHRLEREEDDGA